MKKKTHCDAKYESKKEAKKEEKMKASNGAMNVLRKGKY